MASLLTYSQTTDDLFISEYVEGSSYNKFIEIFNGTGSDVDLSDYQLILFQNGGTDPYRTNDLEGTLLNNSVIVLRDSKATIYEGTVTDATACNFNGNDAIVLYKKSTTSYVDIIGRIGEDPGSAWTSEEYSTLNKTLVRKSSVKKGIAENPESGFSTLATEWICNEQDDITNLGTHTFSPELDPSLNLITPAGGETYYTGQTITIEWEATDVSTVTFYSFEEEEWHEISELVNVDATLLSIELAIPLDVQEGSYKLAIVDDSDESINSESGFFNVVDTTFAGLSESPFYPENDSVGVFTDLVINLLAVNFVEPVAIGDGSIYLKRKSDDAVIETFNKTNMNISVYEDDDDVRTVVMKIYSNLETNTEYYVEVESNVVSDLALTPNFYSGFIGSETWHFTTGDKSFEITIPEIQTPADETGDSPYKDQIVKTSGIITFVDENGFYIQQGAEDYSGLYVNYAGDNKPGFWFSVTLIGKVSEENNMTQLVDVTLLDYIGVDCDCIVEPVEVNLPFGEEHESMLVTPVGLDGSLEQNLDYEWIISDGNATGIVDDKYYCLPQLTLSSNLTVISVAGLVIEEDGVFKLEPRDEEDFKVDYGDLVTSTTTDFTLIYLPDGRIEVSTNRTIEKVTVVSMSGVQIEADNYDGQFILLPAAKSAPGIYFVVIEFEDGIVYVRKVIVQ